MTPTEEQELGIQIDQMWRWNFPCRRKQAIAFANKILARRNLCMDRCVGRKWLSQFLRRNPLLQVKIAWPLHQKRGLLQLSQIQEWMEVFVKTLRQYKIETCDCYNMDEKGVLMGLLKNIGVICKKTSTPTNLIHSGDRELASIIECIFAIGHALPPLIIFKGKWQMKAWHDALPKGVNGKAIGQIATSESGWTNNAIGYEWITKFDVQSKKHQQGKYRLLLIDGHEFHITIKVVQFYLEKKIVLTKMPPHLIHLLQPLDFSVFGPLAMYYRNSLQNLSYSYFNVDKVDFIEIYFAARAKAMSEFNILHAWRDCGYFPFDPEIPCKSILAKKTRPQTPPDQQSQALHSSIDIPYHKHQINHFIWKAVLQGNLSRADVFKLAKAATVNKAKATVKDIQCNKLIESKAREARKSTRRKGN